MLIDITNVYDHLKNDWEERFKATKTNDALKDLINLGMPFEKFTLRIKPKNQIELKKLKCNFIYLDFDIIDEFEDHTLISITTRYNYNDGDEIISMKYFYEINKDGTLKWKLKHGSKFFFSYIVLTDLIPQGEEVCMQENGLVYISFFALQLINCRNVELKELDPNSSLSSKIRRKISRGHQKKQDKYHILNIKPFNSKVINISEYEETNTKLKFHICRGHFKTYKGKGLFGKIKGTFWFPSHAKGNKDIGEITKDYNVKI